MNKGGAIPILATKVYRGRGVTAALILNLSTRCRQVVSLMPRLIYPRRKSFQHPMKRRQGVPKEPVWMSWSTKKFPCAARICTASSSW
jgi:hypothetical protein